MTYYFSSLFVAFILFCIGMSLSSKDKSYEEISHNRGKITKFEFEGHSYVGWTCNMGCSIVHDPDCKCKKN